MAKRSKRKKALPKTKQLRQKEADRDSRVLPARPHWKLCLQMFVIVAAALWIYWPTLSGEWLWDDNLLVTDNLELRSFYGLWKIWFAAPSTDYWPLTWTLLWTEWHLWGNETLGYHLCSLIFHITSGLLVWRLFNRLGLRCGWLGGLLFVIHPLAVESVAWISEIKNTLSLPLFLLSLNAWLDEEEGKPQGYVKSVLYYLAAMLAKTSTVMLPAVLLLYCWWKRGCVTRQEVKRMIPYGAIALVLGSVTVYFQIHGRDVSSTHLGGLGTRLVAAGTALCFYFGKFILPFDLLPIYPHWAFQSPSPLQLLIFPALICLFLVFWAYRKTWGRHVLFGSGFFLINLSPVLGLVKMEYLVTSPVADHFIYLPMIGLVGLIVAGLEQVHERASSSLQYYGMGAMLMLTACLMWEGHAYAKLFINKETLWTYNLEFNPQAWQAHNGLGTALIQEGRLQEAAMQFQQALKIDPNNAEVVNNLGGVLLKTGRLAEALGQFEEALKINPELAGTHNNLAQALGQMGRGPEAMDEYREAIKIDPDMVKAHHNLGVALLQTGQMTEAREQFEQALEIDPDYADARNNLGIVLLQSGHVAEAIDQFEQAIKLSPNLTEAHSNLGVALSQMGRTSEAIDEFKQALKIDPNYANARIYLEKLEDPRNP